MIVDLDILDGASCDVTKDGLTIRRVANVQEIDGPLCDRTARALEAPGIAKVGEQHPSRPGLYCQSVSAQPNGPDNATVTMTYGAQPISFSGGGTGSRSRTQIQIGATVQQVEAKTDCYGNTVLVHYIDADRVQHSCPAKINRSVYHVAVRTTRENIRGTPQSLAQRASNFVGTMSDGGSLLRVAATSGKNNPGGPFTPWLCTELGYTSTDGGKSYTETATFEYDARCGWVEAAYVDPNTGESPSDVTHENGVEWFKAQPVGSFPIQ